MNKTISKVLASMLVITLTCANLILLGTYATESYALSDVLETQTTRIKDKVDFDVYFLDEKGEKTHSKTMDIHSQETLYVSINVLEGYLRNAKIEFADVNFQIEDVSAKYEQIQSISGQTMILNQLGSGNEVIFEIPIKVSATDTISLDYFTKENQIRMSGSVIANNGRTVDIQHTIKTNLNLHGQANPVVTQQVSKFTPYHIGENTGFMMQTTVTSGLENQTLPIEETKIELKVPTLTDGTKPSHVNVSANSLASTKNDVEGVTFDSNSWTYDAETGLVSILVRNEKTGQNVVSWGRSSMDEFTVTYVFEGKEIPTQTPIPFQASVKITAYNNETTVVETAEQKEMTIEEPIGNIVTFAIETMPESLGKGYVYAGSNYETEYQTKWIADLGYVDFIDQLTMNQNTDVFLNEEGETYATSVGGTNETYYKATSITKDNFTKILGTDETASITIYDATTSSVLATINSATPVDADGNMVVTYPTETNCIVLQTSKPVKEGTLEILHTKAIKAKTNYVLAQLQTFTALRTDFVGTAMSQGSKVVETQQVNDIELTEPTTKIEALANNAKEINLSTVVKNENIELKVILKNTDVTANLFKNPVVDIIFPSYIEQTVVNNIGLLFDDEITFHQEDIQIYHTEDGRVGLRVPLTGTQTIYNSNPTQNGTNLVLNTDITVKQLTPSVTDKIEVYVSNENATGYEQEKEGKAYQEIQTNFVAPVGMVTMNSIYNYHSDNEQVTSITGREVTGELPIQAQSKIATMKLTIIDNYNTICKNVNILGRFPVAGNKAITSGEDLGSTFSATLKSGIRTISGISAENVVVYYSQRENATKDLNNPENGWTTDLQSLPEVRSYLIVLNNYEMQQGQILEFAYDIEIPENLKYSESTYGTYVVYFDNISEIQTIQDKSIATRVGVSTKEGPKLESMIMANVENGATVQEGQIIKYMIAIKNVGETEADNIKVVSPIPKGSVYVEYASDGYGPSSYKTYPDRTAFESTIDTIAPGKTKTLSYQVKVSSIQEENPILRVSATIGDYQTEEIQNPVIKGYLQLSLETDRATIGENEKVSYTIHVTNANEEEKTNIIVSLPIPNEMQYNSEGNGKEQILYNGDMSNTGGTIKESDINATVSYQEENHALICHIDRLPSNYEIVWTPKLTTNTLSSEETKKEIRQNLMVTCDQTTNILTSNEITLNVTKPKLEIKQESDIVAGDISVGDVITYHVDIKNTGEGTAYNAKMTDYLPDGLRYIQTKYTIGNQTVTVVNGYKTAEVTTDILKEQMLSVDIQAQVEELSTNETTREITNEVKVSADNVEEIEANKITHIINSESSGIQPGSEEIHHRITGTVWEDNNQDGKREDDEMTLQNIETVLINSETGNTVARTSTDSSGKYTFDNLEEGEYMVAFLCDTTQYEVTEYQKEGVNDSRNSDAIQNSVIVDGTTLNGAITDTISIAGTNVYNIDLGLVPRNRFDLSLTKSIRHVAVKTSRGTQNYNYEDGTNLVKIDIAPKRIEGASVAIEYVFAVHNEGNVPGYVNKIVDYLPNELKFSTNINPDWYQAENGNIYNTTLANMVIQPGETKEVTLTLTKTMTGEDTGVISNQAEIYEAYNELGLMDMNSTPGNKANGENDMGLADVLITVNTGGTMLYIIITILCLGMVGVGVYLINKKILKRSI